MTPFELGQKAGLLKSAQKPGLVTKGLGTLGGGLVHLLDQIIGERWGTKNLLRGKGYELGRARINARQLPPKIQGITDSAAQAAAADKWRKSQLRRLQMERAANVGTGAVALPLAYMLGTSLANGGTPPPYPQQQDYPGMPPQ